MRRQKTGMGCALTSFIACFTAVEKDKVVATTAATAIYGVVGSISAEKGSGPGSFQQIFLDTLYNLKEENFVKYLKITKC